ncbi:RNA polymerase factor sigma-54 [Gluconacetobacter tumulisoli]|uniref:RNA polymerase sigma-54 factor n=1 Tax=Gluconacetobacter tumulisoli TaxID=1286189 RepID=A0A7W4K6B5_9PROT|nr:RNA polymerase factor sigma-54 [Gluconacetobacter tumulisoli]MBB2201193.1 RNA polymerase factor sigma-54 [Gluconacetobacter tumulisoli]
MAIGPKLALRQAQSLVMTPQLRQAILLLQLSNLDACSFIETELERNPLLEVGDRPDDPSGPDDIIQATGSHPGIRSAPFASGAIDEGAAFSASWRMQGRRTYDVRPAHDDGPQSGRDPNMLACPPPSLADRLAEQLRLSPFDAGDRLIGAHLITLLDEAGRLPVTNAATALSLGTTSERVERVRQAMMRFEPTGLFAHDVGECFAAQLRERGRLDPAMAALLRHLDLVARRDMRRLQAICGVDADDLADMIAELRTLSPYPGRDTDHPPAAAIVPDVLMSPAPDGDWFLELNPETTPRVVVNSALGTRITLRAGREERRFLNERLASANWLVRALQQRADTIIRVATAIMRRQDAFLEHGVGHLRPLGLRNIADAVALHESTVSRVTAHKYIATPRGIFELKYFFSTAIPGLSGDSHSAEAIRHRIRALVAAEMGDAVLSDDAIVNLLRDEGIDIARRTVAKYRDALKIPSSVQRKREKAFRA